MTTLVLDPGMRAEVIYEAGGYCFVEAVWIHGGFIYLRRVKCQLYRFT